MTYKCYYIAQFDMFRVQAKVRIDYHATGIVRYFKYATVRIIYFINDSSNSKLCGTIRCLVYVVHATVRNSILRLEINLFYFLNAQFQRCSIILFYNHALLNLCERWNREQHSQYDNNFSHHFLIILIVCLLPILIMYTPKGELLRDIVATVPSFTTQLLNKRPARLLTIIFSFPSRFSI